jgi:hypothetical protein
MPLRSNAFCPSRRAPRLSLNGRRMRATRRVELHPHANQEVTYVI